MLGIYARETGEGMVFTEQDLGPEPPDRPQNGRRGRRREAAAAQGRQIDFFWCLRRLREAAERGGRCGGLKLGKEVV